MAPRSMVVKINWMIQKGMRTFLSHGDFVAGFSAISTPVGSAKVEWRGHRVEVRRLGGQEKIAWRKETDTDLRSLQPCLGLNQPRNENKIKTREGNMVLLYMTFQPALFPSTGIGFPAIITILQ